jgi:hypothetical protein
LETLEYLKIETRLIDEKFVSVMGEHLRKSQTNFAIELGTANLFGGSERINDLIVLTELLKQQ